MCVCARAEMGVTSSSQFGTLGGRGGGGVAVGVVVVAAGVVLVVLVVVLLWLALFVVRVAFVVD